MERVYFVLSGLFGATAVALGAFGAHGLKKRLASLEDGAQRLAWWDTAAHYHLVHALALAVAAYLVARTGSGAATTAGTAFIAGIVLFSGSLYAMTLSGMRWLGAVTPLGGLAFIVGWIAVAIAAWRLQGSD